MLVSLVLALTLTLLIGGALTWLLNSNLILREIAQSTNSVALTLQPELEDPEHTPKSIGNNLGIFVIENERARRQDTSRFADANAIQVVITDPAGRVITSTDTIMYPNGAQLLELEPDDARPVLQAALQGITNTTQLAAWLEPQHHAIAAAPVIGSNGNVIGITYTRYMAFPSTSIILTSLSSFLLGAIIPWLAISGLVGLLYAWMAGRGFSQRLKRLTEASAALASGNLSRRVEDSSADEIGQLARQFNIMADQLDEHMHALRLLAEQNARLAEQAAQLATVEERNRLARDLHDSVSQELFSLTMLAAAAKRQLERRPETAAGQLGEIQEIAQRALQETRGLIFALRPAALDDRGLAPALRDLAAAAQERQGLVVHLRVGGERRLPLDHEQALFRIVQEALANVVRHSGAHEAEVALQYDDACVHLVVSDQGRGFNTSAPRNVRAVGLASMAERAAALGGTFEVCSNPGIGTRVEVGLPVPG